ncbi:MAG TPA: hypothetical protein DCO75_05375 [Fibrobacteres bacterium]|nr:hypothetical protein [Fibrobacterota bacterium]
MVRKDANRVFWTDILIDPDTLSHITERRTMISPLIKNANKSLLYQIVVIIVLVSGFCVIAGKYVSYRIKNIKFEKEEELSAVADLKVNQIIQWKNNWVSHGNVYMHDQMLRNAIKKWLSDKSDNHVQKEIEAWINLRKEYAPFQEIHICDTMGNKLISSTEPMKPFPLPMAEYIDKARNTHNIVFSDFHKRAIDGQIHIDMIVPIIDSTANGSRFFCLAVFAIDPSKDFFPIIQSWPTSNKSAETLLFHRKGDSVEYINELRHKTHTALVFRLSAKTPYLPAAMALNGKVGIVEGMDYRGIPVIAALRHIPESPWYMASKIDKQEILLPQRKAIIATFVFLFGFVTVTFLLIVIIERSKSSRHYHALYKEQQKTQAALLDSEHFSRTIIMSAKQGISVWDKKQRCKIWNNYMEEMTGVKENEVLGRYAGEIFPNLWKKGFDAYMSRALAGETMTSDDMSYNTSVFNGKTGWMLCTFCPHIDSSGVVVGAIVITRDITLRRNAVEEIANQREHLAVTLRSIGDGVISTDNKGRIVLMNRVAENLTGWKLTEAMGRPLVEVFNIINEQTRKPCDNPVEKVFKTGGIVNLENHTVLLSRDGREIVIADSGAPIKDKESKTIGVVLVFRDNTEKQKTAENMMKVDKLESIGVLAGGIAHDFNNLLSGIFGYVDLAREMCKKDDNVMDALMKALNVLNRARDLTRQLLTFSKGGVPAKATLYIASIITDTAQFVLSGSTVRCEFSIPGDLWSCDVDGNQISQVVDNIVINAQQAMPQGGKISISAENVTIDNKSSMPLNPGNYVKIRIEDHGAGIPKEYFAKIFDPFFTTKQKGSGLGLATCFSIIKKHDGFIDLESELGKGTTFFIYLPASETQFVNINKPDDTVKNLRGSGRILIMDDEDFIQDVAGTMLEMLGYDVVTVANGEEALDQVKRSLDNENRFKIAILDLTIPGGMGGVDTVKAIRKIDPGIKAIASSGYSTDPVMSDPKFFGFSATITKPYLKDELGTVILSLIT